MAMRRTEEILLLNKWLWITILGCIAVMIGPILIIYIIALMPVTFKVASMLVIMIGWGVAGGYKDWAVARRKEQKLFTQATET